MNAQEGEGTRVWEAAGRPILPSLVLDGVARPIAHVSQLASFLGLAPPTPVRRLRAAWDTVAVLGAWLEHLRQLHWQILVEPTPSRGRTLRELTVNVFHPFELLPAAWESRHFDWHPERDAEREAQLQTMDAVIDFAQRAYDGWNVFLLEVGDDFDSVDPLVSSPRGELPFSTVLAAHRWHAAFHYRQVQMFLESAGIELRDPLALEVLRDLELPGEVF